MAKVVMFFYASANVVVRAIMFPECLSIRQSLSPKQTLLARYLGYFLDGI